jgi:hypothetical protein
VLAYCTYDEIKDALGFDGDRSFLMYKKEAARYGYQAGNLSKQEKQMIFNTSQ